MAGELEGKQQNWIETTRSYLGDVRSEMKRVTWPSREKVQATTLVVIISVFVFAAYFYVVDKVLQHTVVAAQAALVK